MANTLGKLFQDIATAIRSKTGEAGTMKPAEFPAKIAQIMVGTGGGSDKNVVYKTGSIYEPTATMTIDHGVGFVPDMIGLFCLGESKATAVIQWSINFSNAIINACDGDAPGKTATMTNGVYKMGIGQVRGFETTTVPMAGVYSVTDTSFTVGGTLATLDVDCFYAWFAIGGLM